MTAIITSKFRIYNAAKFKEQIEDADTTKNLYLFIGKPDSWSPNDTIPDTTLDTVSEDMKRWYDMISMKKIQEANVSHCVPRYDWDATGDTKYVAYSDTDSDLLNHPTAAEVAAAASAGTYTAGSFYVMTDEFNVYICLFNNGNAKSTTKPTGRSTDVFETADGYKWKYIYTVSSAETLKFVTDDFIPIKTLTSDDSSNQWQVQSTAVDGALDIIKVTAGGTGYTDVIVNGTLSSGSINGGVLPGSASALDNAYVGATIYILTGPGAGESQPIITYTGSTRTFVTAGNWTVTPNGTSTFDILPTVTISGDGSSAKAKATVSGGVVTKITVTTRGTGYRTATVAISGGGGTGATGIVVIPPFGGHGKDPVKQLGGFFVMMNVKLEFTEEDFPNANDYRRIGIVSNVKNSSDSQISTALTRSATKQLSLTSVSGTFLADELVQSNGAGTPTAKVVEYGATSGSTGVLRYFQNSATDFLAFAGTQQVTGVTSGATGIINSVADREILFGIGDILYIENRRPIMRAVDQVEVLMIVCEF